MKSSFFDINEVAKTRTDVFYLVINVRIIDKRQSVAIFACKREEWNDFLKKNYKDYSSDCLVNSDKGKETLRDALKSCFKGQSQILDNSYLWILQKSICFQQYI